MWWLICMRGSMRSDWFPGNWQLSSVGVLIDPPQYPQLGGITSNHAWLCQGRSGMQGKEGGVASDQSQLIISFKEYHFGAPESQFYPKVRAKAPSFSFTSIGSCLPARLSNLLKCVSPVSPHPPQYISHPLLPTCSQINLFPDFVCMVAFYYQGNSCFCCGNENGHLFNWH